MRIRKALNYIQYYMLYGLLFSVLLVQANEMETKSLAQQEQLIQGIHLPAGLSSQDWIDIQVQINASDYQYRADPHGGYTSTNPVHGWNLYFDVDGTTTLKPNSNSAQSYHIGMKLSAVGYQNLQALVKPQQISSQDNKLIYQWNNNLREWWINSDTQLEQWFSLTQKPLGAVAGQALILQIELDTELKPIQHGNALQFETPTGHIIRYNKLAVWDATGEQIPVQMQLAGNSLSLVVDDENAHYPLTIDPSFQQVAYLKASNTVEQLDFNRAAARFGTAVAIDGETLVVGAPGESSNARGVNGNELDTSAGHSGAVYVFVRSGSGWIQQAYLKASNAEGDHSIFDKGDFFGKSVAISGDTIVVGAPGEDSDATGIDGNQMDNSAENSGAAYVFVRHGSDWTQQAYLKASNTGSNTILRGAGDLFGTAVAIAGDTIVVGATGESSIDTGVNADQHDNSLANAGAAYVFVRDETTWIQQAYLKASNVGTAPNSDNKFFSSFRYGMQFGNAVAISGETIVVGAFWEDSHATGVDGDQNDTSSLSAGAAYVFVRNGFDWTQQAYLKASNTEHGFFEDRFATSVAISGETIVIGSPLEDSLAKGVNGDQYNNHATSAGAAYVFTRTNSLWSQQAYLKASNTDAKDFFGSAVAIDGNTIIVGAEHEASNAIGEQNNNDAFWAGAGYVFQREDTSWTQQSYLKAVNANIDGRFGSSVAIFDNNIVVGAPGDNSSARGVNGDHTNRSVNSSGAGFIFSLTEADSSPGNQISGFVWIDANANGIQDVGESPYQANIDSGRLEVSVYPVSTQNAIATTFIDKNSQGRYLFNHIPDGQYYICISANFLQFNYTVTEPDVGQSGIIDGVAGHNGVDSDFDSSPCSYDLSVNSNQTIVRDLGLIGESFDPPSSEEPTTIGNQVSGFVWLDNNGDGLQSNGEPGFASGSNGIGVTTVELYLDGVSDAIAVAALDEQSGGRYSFSDLTAGFYYVCTSSEFKDLGLSVTPQNAGDDSIDSDFDDDPCAYNVTVTDSQGAQIDLGLVGGPLDSQPPVDPPVGDDFSDIKVQTTTLSVNHLWQPVAQLPMSDNLVVFFSAATNHGAQRGVARMRRVDNSAQFRFQEWSNLDGRHTHEVIHAASFPIGSWQAGNTRIDVGKSEISGTGIWKTINFHSAFTRPPAVILSLQSANGPDAVDVHVRNITANSMQIALYEEEAKMFSGHVSESVAYLLVSTDEPINLGKGSAQLSLPYQATGLNVNHDWVNIADNYQIRLEEDQTLDEEILHTLEIVQVMKLNDFYLTQIASAAGADPSVLRSHQ